MLKRCFNSDILCLLSFILNVRLFCMVQIHSQNIVSSKKSVRKITWVHDFFIEFYSQNRVGSFAKYRELK